MKKLLDDYFSYLRNIKGLSDNTLEAYKRDLLQFNEYLDVNDSIKLTEVNKTQIITYLMYLQNKNRAGTTINRILSSLRCFYQYLLNNKLIDEDPTFNLKGPQSVKKQPDILTPKEVDKFLSLPKVTNYKGARDKAMLELLYGTGMRVSELVSLDLENINLEIGYIEIGMKSSEERVVPIGKVVNKYLKNYIDNFRKKVLKNKNEKALFLNYRGKRLTRQGFWKIVKNYTKQIRVNKNITPQTLRHSFVIHLLESGANLEMVQEILGHSNISIINSVQLRDVYKKTHPRV